MIDTLVELIFVGGAMIVLLETGRRIGRHAMENDPAGSHQGLGQAEAGIFGLMGLIIALTFSAAATRFEQRRMLIIDEANAIGTAYLRIDLLPGDLQAAIRNDFRDYLQTRIDLYHNISDSRKVSDIEMKAASLQNRIWKESVCASQSKDNLASALLLLPALNSMFDICSTRTAVRQIHQPNVVFIVMILQALICSLIAGYGMAIRRSRSWIHLIGFTLVLLITLLVIIDMEYPRTGFIRIDTVDALLTDLKKLMQYN